MSSGAITDALVREVAADLRTRYSLDEDDLRTLGARLAESAQERRQANVEFAERFVDEHRETFDRLSQ